jgi:lysophospholipase L1-like esterase
MTTVATDPHCITDEDAATLLQHTPWRRLAVIGDSMAAGVGDEVPGYPSGGWAATVARVLERVRPDRAYLNLGERDRYAAQVREHQLPRALSFRPDLAVVLCGGNDLLRARFDVDAVAAEIDAMVGAFREQGADVITYGLLDITRSGLMPTVYAGAFRERLRAYGEAVGDVSARHGAIHIVLTDHPAAAEQSSYSSDFLHASARGHAVIAAVTMRRLAQLSG